MNYLSISNSLRQIRHKVNLTQEEVAEFFSTDVSLIEKWESGITEPTISEALVLSKLYGCSLDDMFSGVDVQKMIPAEALETFERILLKNRMCKRWYD